MIHRHLQFEQSDLLAYDCNSRHRHHYRHHVRHHRRSQSRHQLNKRMKCESCRDLYFRSAAWALHCSIIIEMLIVTIAITSRRLHYRHHRPQSFFVVFFFLHLVSVLSQNCEVGILLIATEMAGSQSLCLNILAFD